MIVEINDKEFNLKEAKTEEQKKKGLQGVDNLPDDEGMIFIYDEPQEVSFWMEGVDMPLLIVFVNEDFEVIKVKEGKPNDTEPITCENTMYVIEVSTDNNIYVGDEVDLEDDDNVQMEVLAPDGSVQMLLQGGERIYSRIHTKNLIRLANIADETKDNEDYEKLGAAVFRYIKKQDSTEQDFVELK